MIFNDPYDKPFRLISIAHSGPSTALEWESVRGQPYVLQGSTNLADWNAVANNLVATGSTFLFVTNAGGPTEFFRVVK